MPTSLTVSILFFDALSSKQLYELLRLRSAVFVVEQECIYQDIDNKDQNATHVLGYIDNELVAYTRVFGPGDYFKEASIGRVLVKSEHRIFGRGKEIVQASMDWLTKTYEQPIRISAQTYLTKFYTDLGFLSEGETYLEDGIPHINMVFSPVK
ncbi:MAG: GNAT family N-acetyltransferase [Bacteroidota bacterium]